MGIFGRRRTSVPVEVERCGRCGDTDLAIGFVDRVSMTVTRRCEACGSEWREPFVAPADLGRVLSGYR